MTYSYDRTAAAKYDVWADLMAVHRKAKEIEWKGVSAVLTKVSRAAKAFGYALDPSSSYITFRVGRSDQDSPEGDLIFVPLPSRDTWASEDEMRKFLADTFDLYGVRGLGDGKFRVSLGG